MCLWIFRGARIVYALFYPLLELVSSSIYTDWPFAAVTKQTAFLYPQ